MIRKWNKRARITAALRIREKTLKAAKRFLIQSQTKFC